MDSRKFCTDCLQHFPVGFCLVCSDGGGCAWLGEGKFIARVWKGQCHAHVVSLTTTGLPPTVAGLLGGCFHVLFVSCSSPWHLNSLHLWFREGLTTAAPSSHGGGRASGWALYRGWGTETKPGRFHLIWFYTLMFIKRSSISRQACCSPRECGAGSVPAPHQDGSTRGPVGVFAAAQHLCTLSLCCSVTTMLCFAGRTVDRRPGEGVKRGNRIISQKQLNPGGYRYSVNLFWARTVYAVSFFTDVSLCFKSALTQPQWLRLWSLN